MILSAGLSATLIAKTDYACWTNVVSAASAWRRIRRWLNKANLNGSTKDLGVPGRRMRQVLV